MYQSIANTEHRRLLKEERDAFYKESVVNINEVSTQVKSAKKAQYGKTDVGVVECDIDVKGTRNDQAFEKIYDYADGSQLSDKCCISVWGWGYYVE